MLNSWTNSIQTDHMKFTIKHDISDYQLQLLADINSGKVKDLSATRRNTLCSNGYAYMTGGAAPVIKVSMLGHAILKQAKK